MEKSQIEASTLTRKFHEAAQKHGAKAALRYKVDKKFQDITYADLARRVEEAVSGLVSLGVTKGDRVAILSENRPEWAVSDLAALSVGAAVVPLYPTLPSAQIAYIVRNSGAKVLVVENAKQFKKISDARADLPELKHILVIEPDDKTTGDGVVPWSVLAERGKAEPLGAKYAGTWQSITPDDLAALVYTSGTTGDPKGAMLTHGSVSANVLASLEHFRRQGEAVTEADTFLSFLPLSHAFERTTGHYLPLFVGAAIAYCEGVRTIVDDMVQTQPTLMVCVPRVYESMQERIEAQAAKAEPSKQEIFKNALETGKAYADARRGGGLASPVLYAKRLAFEKLVFAKLRERFGGKFRFFVSGGAALSEDTARFFEAVGIPVMEGYGMTEASPVMAVNPNRRVKLGTVGVCLPGGEIKIADDGEILYRGPNIMKGYWQNEQATGEVVKDGWLHTGDVGVLDEEGYLKITDRKKDIIVLANGKNVAPQPIEAALKRSPFISEVVLIGDKQSIVTALVLPNKSKLSEWAKGENLAFDSDETLLELPEAKKKIKQELDAQSRDLAEFERVKKFKLLNATFSVDSGEMTPTLKIKRKVVMQKYAREVAELRGDATGDAA